MKVRLLQVMLAPGDGGAENFFEKLAIAFQEKGICQRMVICTHAERRARLEEAGCDVVEIPAQGWRKWLAKGRVQQISADFQPTHQMAWMSRAAMCLQHVPGCVNLARLGGYYPLKYYTTCDWLVGNTPSVIKHLGKIGWPTERTRQISNFGELPDAVAEKDALVAELDLPEGVPVLLTLGRLHVNKAQDVLIEALADIPGAILLIAGEGPLEASLKAQAAALGVSERVRFLGWRRDTPALFEVADVCAFPSRQEPLGNVVLEAWAHSVPIAAAASEGPAWLIEHEKNGLLFPIDDVAACAGAVNRLLSDPALVASCKAGGQAKWQAQFSKEAIVRQYVDFFNEIRSVAVMTP
jgi:glycosyltransferase involved in cell wall biosynthesis